MFQPTAGISGYAGWRVLQQTEIRQRETFEQSPSLERTVDYFKENIGTISSAEELVKDRRLLTVALGAFGLSDEINKGGLIRKILEDGTENDDALANRFNDSRFQLLAETFSFGNSDGPPDFSTSEFQDNIVSRFKTREFEVALGESDNDMRLAMNFRREILEFSNPDLDDRVAWLRLMAQSPLRELMSTALNLPSSVSQLDVDRQQEIFAEKTESIFGNASLNIFEDPTQVENLIRRFFLSRQVQNGPSEITPGFTALTLLQSNNGLGSASSAGLLLSQV